MQKKYQILKKNYELLSEMIALSETRNPVQGEFYFGTFNYGVIYTEEEGVLNCGTQGCLAGGYLPLIDNKRFYFDKNGDFMDGKTPFHLGQLNKELGEEVFESIFMPRAQILLELPILLRNATREEVIDNAKKVLALLEVVES